MAQVEGSETAPFAGPASKSNVVFTPLTPIVKASR
jgi:hypothetical protein